MKKIIYLLLPGFLCTIFSMPLTASQPQPPQKSFLSFFNQWRAGFGLAGEYLNLEAKLKVQPSPGLENIGTQQSQTGKHLQVAPCLELGNSFGNAYYLGLLISWRYIGLKSNAQSLINDAQYFKHEFRLRDYTDILMKTGYKVAPHTMVYALIGPSLANWEHNSKQFASQLQLNKFQLNKAAVGLGLGIGIEHFIHKNYAFSIDYTHHFHRPVSKNYSMTYEVQDVLLDITTFSGNLNRKIDLSYATIALRFTAFFQL